MKKILMTVFIAACSILSGCNATMSELTKKAEDELNKIQNEISASRRPNKASAYEDFVKMTDSEGRMLLRIIEVQNKYGNTWSMTKRVVNFNMEAANISSRKNQQASGLDTFLQEIPDDAIASRHYLVASNVEAVSNWVAIRHKYDDTIIRIYAKNQADLDYLSQIAKDTLDRAKSEVKIVAALEKKSFIGFSSVSPAQR
jgi:hypothetical protein